MKELALPPEISLVFVPHEATDDGHLRRLRGGLSRPDVAGGWGRQVFSLPEREIRSALAFCWTPPRARRGGRV